MHGQLNSLLLSQSESPHPSSALSTSPLLCPVQPLLAHTRLSVCSALPSVQYSLQDSLCTGCTAGDWWHGRGPWYHAAGSYTEVALSPCVPEPIEMRVWCSPLPVTRIQRLMEFPLPLCTQIMWQRTTHAESTTSMYLCSSCQCANYAKCGRQMDN